MAREVEVVEPAPSKARPSQRPRYLAIAATVLVIVVAMLWMRGRSTSSVTSAPTARGGSASAPPQTPAIPVVAVVIQPATLTQSLQITGSLKTDAYVVLSTKLAGRIAMLAVKEGDEVRAGQLVARLDDGEQQAQRARAAAAVRAAEAKLSQTAASSTVKDTGAEGDYHKARAAVAAARAKLAQVEHTARIQDTTAETRVRTARAGLQSAKERLGMLRVGSRRQELQMAQQSVRQAEINLSDAQRKYNRRQQLFKEGAISEQDVEDSQRQFELAQAQLKNAQEQQNMVQEGPRSEEVRMAEQQMTQAEQALQDAEANRVQREISQEEVTAAREAVHQAEAAERSARAGLVQRQLSREDVRTAAATVDQLRADVSYYDELIRQTRIIAPVAGTVTQKLVNQGEYVGLGAKLVNIVSRDTLFLEAVVSERQLPWLRTGQPARISVDARPGRVYGGVVREILPVAEGLSRSSRVRITLRGGRDLPIGAFARASVPTAHRVNVVAVPADAVLSEAGVNYVFTIVNGHAKRRNIELGIRDRNRIEVTSGLRPGDRIIIAGSPAVVDGAAVAPQH